jgi:hypothetical protein
VTYEKIYDLKFRRHVPTFLLRKRFPREAEKIARIALLQLPLSVLRELIRTKRELHKVLALRKSLTGRN